MKNTVVFDSSAQNPRDLRTNLKDTDRLESLLKVSGKVLFKTSSVFPFDLFPDELTIDEYKVNIVSREFFSSEEVHSITIDMIKDIEIETSPLFAILKIVPDGYPGRVLEVKYLNKKDAIKARKIIQGLIVAKKQGLDLVNLDYASLVKSIEKLGETHIVE